ncbi:hypothetical protein RchiOBHm_Chr1g0382101 [Rosa chinensis]|uniref:Transmembrane protein n=1 Tax=Rosa chinensis TaxID=74649 RepID=A0A2P6SPC1_ROSCH|nr:hypothetical protein RchiOBHm_Chr1g0382101 [Rosa chinensis]
MTHCWISGLAFVRRVFPLSFIICGWQRDCLLSWKFGRHEIDSGLIIALLFFLHCVVQLWHGFGNLVLWFLVTIKASWIPVFFLPLGCAPSPVKRPRFNVSYGIPPPSLG